MQQLAQEERHVKLFRNGRNQAVRIPREFELEGNDAIIRKEGNKLIIEQYKNNGIIELLNSWQPLKEEFPDVDKGLLPLDDIEL